MLNCQLDQNKELWICDPKIADFTTFKNHINEPPFTNIVQDTDEIFYKILKDTYGHLARKSNYASFYSLFRVK